MHLPSQQSGQRVANRVRQHAQEPPAMCQYSVIVDWPRLFSPDSQP